jgi:pimeloyl-ACP methyl ester carboxylesterase
VTQGQAPAPGTHLPGQGPVTREREPGQRTHRVALVHGAATTGRVWRHVVPLLAAAPALSVAVPERPCTGDLAAETAALRPSCAGALAAGVSGGATLGLALAAAGVPAAAVLHEPAVGSLLPGLLDQVRAAYADGGVPAFARALYGSAWTEAEAPADPAAVARDLAMFTSFEPAAPAPAAGPVIITVGERSPRARHDSVARLADKFGFSVEVVPGAGHAAHLTHPAAFADLIIRTAALIG